MDTEQLFDASLERVLAQQVEGRDFFAAFYDDFLAGSELVAEKFRHTDMERQATMLKKSFYHLLSFYVTNEAGYYLERVALSHNWQHLDIPPELYDRWLETLIATLRHFDPQVSDEVELAWRLVMTPGIVYMKFHYHRSSIAGHAAPSPESG